MNSKKKKKKSPKSMEELTKGYEDFEKRNEVKEISKADFEKVIKKAVKKNKN